MKTLVTADRTSESINHSSSHLADFVKSRLNGVNLVALLGNLTAGGTAPMWLTVTVRSRCKQIVICFRPNDAEVLAT